ncbi:MAG: polysaccharide biosynthesis protein [Negativicutes bacterium]|nr:polysaccharide biosynthesis protein [Negativicutes bacterium]
MSKDKVLKGAFIITFGYVVVKIIGAVNRVLLFRILGGEGVGLYQMAYPIYLTALQLSTAGLPVAISIMVAEKISLDDWRGARRIFRISLSVMVAMGVVLAAGLYFGAEWFRDHVLEDSRAYLAIISLSPAVLICTLLASFRGYFQGLQRMTPTAASQIVEQLGRVVGMLVLAWWLVKKGIEFGAAGATAGAAIGAVFSLAILLAYYWRHLDVIERNIAAQTQTAVDSTRMIVSRMIKLALPVSLGNLMVPVGQVLDMLIVPTRLKAAGFDVSQATTLFGYLTGGAGPLIVFATILPAGFATSLVPAISEALTLNNRRVIYECVKSAIRVANLITVPATVVLACLATPIAMMLYRTPEAGPVVAVTAIGIYFLGLQQVTTGALQGLNRTALPFVNLIVSGLVKVILAWVLTAIPGVDIIGAGWATVADFAVAAFLNVFFVYRLTGCGWQVRATLRIAAVGLAMGGAAHFAYQWLLPVLHGNNTLATVAALAISAVVYAVLLLLIGEVTAADVRRVPVAGDRLTEAMLRWRLIRK